MTDAELLAEIEATPATASRTEAVLRGGVQGLTLGTSDEVAGALKATKLLKIPQDIRTPGPKKLAQMYPGTPYPDAASRWFNENRPDLASVAGAESARQEQRAGAQLLTGEERAKNDAAYNAHPGYYMAGAIGGGALPLIATGGKAATILKGAKETIPAMVRRLAPEVAPVLAQGGVQGLGYSTNDTGTGLLGDSALGVAGGLGGYAVGKLLGQAVQGVGGLAGRRTAAAAARAEQDAAKAAAADVASKAGTYGGLRQTENKAILNLLSREQSGLLDAANQASLEGLKKSGRVAAALNESAANDLEFLATRIPEVASAKSAAAAARAALPQTVADETAKGLSRGEARHQVWERVKRYGPVAIGSGIGAAIGGPVGVAVGSLAGAGTRPMVRALVRMTQNPAVQTALWNPVQRGVAAATTPTMSLLGRTASSAAGMSLVPNMSQLGPSPEEQAAEAELQRLLSGSP